jgi:hypothetical protein
VFNILQLCSIFDSCTKHLYLSHTSIPFLFFNPSPCRSLSPIYISTPLGAAGYPGPFHEGQMTPPRSDMDLEVAASARDCLSDSVSEQSQSQSAGSSAPPQRVTSFCMRTDRSSKPRRSNARSQSRGRSRDVLQTS